MKDIELCAEKLRKNGFLVLEKKGHADKGYSPFVNNWNIYQPWLNHDFLKKVVNRILEHGVRTLVSYDRLYVLYQILQNTSHIDGEIWEAGVYQGGTALLFAEVIREELTDNMNLRLFDTFEGMPQTHDTLDKHKLGDFNDTSLEAVKKLVGNDDFISYHPGLVPDTYTGLENKTIKFAHIDLDIYEPIKSSCEFIWPRLAIGGAMIFDDYGFSTCPGARKAVDDYFENQLLKPLVLPTGQAIIIKTI